VTDADDAQPEAAEASARVLSDEDPHEDVRHAWVRSDRIVPRTVVRPMQHFLETEVGSGVIMLVAAAIALVWANSPWSDSYFELWGTHVDLIVGDLIHLDHLTLQHWVNDGLMAIFFFVMAMEIKRERVAGELRDPKAAALPAIAALGGMIVPAALYFLLNSGGAGADGWGIPMATDIAFAVGIVSLAGPRVPLGAKVFLLTLAVVDDIGAILVIAVFYTADLAAEWLLLALAAFAVTWVLQRSDVRAKGSYLVLGLVAWFGLLESGVHATLAGVVMGFLTPAWSFHDPEQFAPVARSLVDEISAEFEDERLTAVELQANEGRIQELIRLARESTAPISSLTHLLEPWVAYVIVPIFALANAGVKVSGDTAADAVSEPVVLGIVLGLVVGKTIGVFSATWLAVRLGIGRLPAGTTWSHVLGLAITAGVGFTVALFVASLSFDDPVLGDMAKIGILSASLVAGLLGFFTLRAVSSRVPPGDAALTADSADTPAASTAT
jgi:NhaA family Na+:H+ antiporter